jgi:ribosomal protein S24E
LYTDSDILHPNRANISKDELRGKLAEMYKANKDQVNVFGLQTQYGGGKTTGFALVYDSPEALKKFEPHYRLVRVGMATKIEKPSRQQRTSRITYKDYKGGSDANVTGNRQATQEQTKDSPRYGKGQGCSQEEGQIDGSLFPGVCCRWRQIGVAAMGFVFVRMHSRWLSIWCIRG